MEEGDRSTVVPAFDVAAFARDSEVRQRAAAAVELDHPIEEARRLHLQGAHEEALFLLTRLLEHEPLHPEATGLSVACSRALERDCWSALGPESTILVCAVPTDELKRFALDHVSGFLLSLIDGSTDIEGVLDIAGMPRLLVLRHLRSLLDRGVVAVASGWRAR
jgi:hypothetical protein